MAKKHGVKILLYCFVFLVLALCSARAQTRVESYCINNHNSFYQEYVHGLRIDLDNLNINNNKEVLFYNYGKNKQKAITIDLIDCRIGNTHPRIRIF